MTPIQMTVVAGLVVLLIAAFVLAAAETSFLRVRRSAVVVEAEAGDRRASALIRLLDDLPHVMNAVLLTVLLIQVTAAVIAGVLAERLLGGVGVTSATLLVTLVLFVYGEVIPKTLAVRQPLVIARLLTVPIRWLSILLRPVVSILVRFADAQSPGSGVTTVTAVSEQELRHLAGEAAVAGHIEESDVELIERAFTVGDLRVNQILVPRVDVVAVPGDKSVADALQVAIGSGHRRLPVTHRSIDEITGFVRLRDLAVAATTDPDIRVSELARRVLAVPTSKPVIELLRAMQRSGQHLAVVVDEHGGTAGIVTIEDAVEEFVGTIEDPERERSG